jgi:hypothetical protein
MAVCVLGLLILRRLWQRRILTAQSAMTVAILWLGDIAGFWIGRQARMDSLAEMLGLGAAWVLVERWDDKRSWWLAAVLVGFSFGMHASAVLFWLPFLIALWYFRKQLGWLTAAACAALPIAIVAAIWVSVHRELSLEALALFRTLNSSRTDRGFEWGRWMRFLVRRPFLTKGSLVEVFHIGGLSYWVVLICWALAAARFRVARTNRWMAFAIACSVAHAACAQFVTGVLAQRLILYYPFALLALGLALTTLSPRFERAALVVALLIGVAQFTTMFTYANLPGDRSRNRMDALPLPASTRTVAGTTELWYYYVSRNLPFRLITLERPAFANYWRLHPEHLDQFDAVILPLNDTMLAWPELTRRPKLFFHDFAGTLVICLKSAPMTLARSFPAAPK